MRLKQYVIHTIYTVILIQYVKLIINLAFNYKPVHVIYVNINYTPRISIVNVILNITNIVEPL